MQAVWLQSPSLLTFCTEVTGSKQGPEVHRNRGVEGRAQVEAAGGWIPGSVLLSTAWMGPCPSLVPRHSWNGAIGEDDLKLGQRFTVPTSSLKVLRSPEVKKTQEGVNWKS